MSQQTRAAFRGAFTAVVTPFGADGSLDLDAFARFVDWQVEQGIHGIVPCGTTGEGATLDDDEHRTVIAAAVKSVAGRVPVVAGCGTNDTRRTVAGARRAAAAGADALLVVTPYYNKPNRSGMIAHYRAVADATELPVVVYNVPGRTAQNLGAELILELAEIPGVVAVKEASANLDQIGAVLEGRPAGFAVLGGDDSLTLPSIALGADGVISVVSNEAPREMAMLAAAALEGDLPAARDLHFRLLPLMRANFVETNPVPVKHGVAMLGHCGRTLRAPLGPPSESTIATVRAALEAAWSHERSMNLDELRDAVDAAAALDDPARETTLPLVELLLAGLESGAARAAEPHNGGWVVNAWVKRGILLGFRAGRNVATGAGDAFHFRDRDTFPTWNPAQTGRDVRIVPGGSTVRRGAFLGAGVVVMPPAYVNVGAYVGEETMVDSHALIGSCAQVGRRVHLSAAAQVGGVLEPIGALPVIIEDDVFVGGNCGIYEGTRVGAGGVLAPGTVLTRAVVLHDAVRGGEIRAAVGAPLEVPPGAVVVPGSRPARGAYAEAAGLHVSTPVIVKYRDASTDAAVALEQALR